MPTCSRGVACVRCAQSPASAENAKTVSVLCVHLQNDNEMYEPTTEAERARMTKVGNSFKEQLEISGQFDVKPVPEKMAAEIAAGQTLGECGGCELDYGAKLGVDRIAWINVQKVSNLILNLNVYMADVKEKKMTFVRSVDIRGNTDESWTRSLKYLVKNYLLPDRPSPSG
ncbi:DUF3280 domain-containing protein [Hyphomicrobium sp.]|uniref:DUF3280 domain-containing protein n=1 Tax=Hyphomicrobium sp. TaxID=82 RepID=UPI003F726E4C